MILHQEMSLELIYLLVFGLFPNIPLCFGKQVIISNFAGCYSVAFLQQNKPLNAQNAADALQKFNLKKTAVQKALDSLADSGKISFKEYGKQKIYIAQQDQFEIPNSDDLNRMKEDNAKLQEQISEQKRANSEIEAEIKSLQSNLTLEDMQAKLEKLNAEIEVMETKLTKMRGGVTLVKPEEKKAIESQYVTAISLWRKRKRMFKDVWDSITESLPRDLKELKDELGLEYDEDADVSLQAFSELMPGNRKRGRGQ